jgi:2-oxoglutarate ferredoxin oxidoreductase subunit alpha
MSEVTTAHSQANTATGNPDSAESEVQIRPIPEQIVEIVSDSGEGAQTAGQLFGTVCAKMGNGLWTVEIIPAEIEPPSRSRAGASGIRIRFGTKPVRNMGDEADLVVSFNEQVLYSRIDQGALRPGTVLMIDNKWGESDDPEIRDAYQKALKDFHLAGYEVREIPIHAETSVVTDNPQRGKNMWVVGMLCALYNRDLEIAKREVKAIFQAKRKGQAVIDMNYKLLDAGHAWAVEHFDTRFEIPVERPEKSVIVINGNASVALGCMAAGIEVCAMYPITPATSASHYLAADFHKVGGVVHQAEDEIAAVGFAIGASYAGKTAVTITSGPGLALKTEFLGLAVMAEIPLVVVDVQRGGPSTGLPTKPEQGDLLASIFGQPGDSPKVVMAPSNHEECFHFIVTARKLAEAFRTPVIVLTDASLATAQACFPRPEPDEEWLSPPVDQSPWKEGAPPFAWDPETGLSRRPIPGQPGGMYVLTGLAHDEQSHIAYESAANQRAMTMRSRKMGAFLKALKPPEIYGDEDGDLLVVGWGSTRGAIEEAVDRVRRDGHRAGFVCLRFLSPLEPGLAEIFSRYRRVMTVEVNYSDDRVPPPGSQHGRRYAQLAWMLRAETLVDVDCWSRVPGQPLPPQMIEAALRSRLGGAN